MAEQFEIFKRFEYRLNSNLVLQRDGPGPLQNEPTGEPESLAGRLTSRMGDRVQFGKPVNPEELVEASRRKRPAATNQEEETETIATVGLTRAADKRSKKHRRVKEILKKTGAGGEEDIDDELLRKDEDELFGNQDNGYIPSSEINRAHWENLLSCIEQVLSDQPRDILGEAGVEILTICRADGVTDNERFQLCREILPELDETLFSKCLQISRHLNDFNMSGNEAGRQGDLNSKDDVGDELEMSHGVAVVWDNDDELLEGTLAEEENEPDDETDSENENDDKDNVSAQDDDFKQNDVGELETDKYRMSVAEIGPHWLQRQLRDRQIVSDEATKLIALEKAILAELDDPDVAAVENKLVALLEYEHFDFIQRLTSNHWRILYMTELGQAQTEAEKTAIKERMTETPGGQSVLEELELQKAKRNREQDFARSVRKEAQALTERSVQNVGVDNIDDEIEDSKFGKQTKVTMEDGGDEEEDRQPLATLNLAELAFPQDKHFIGVDDVRLPEGTERTARPNYEEIRVPPTKTQVTGESLAVADCLPEWARPAFAEVGVSRLNLIQSKVFKTAFTEPDKNLLICAPTGAGKTNVAMLTILGTMSQYYKNGAVDANQFKIIYVSPMKALVAEQVAAFQRRLDCLGNIKVRELTGDIGLSQRQIEETQIIVTTPEKWDVITRKSGERTYTQLVKLMIFDEIHLLHDSRGPVLEALIARAIRQSEVTQKPIRLVGLSATLPNFEDVAIFMRVPLGPTGGLFVFGNHYRPVPLEQSFVGVRSKKALKRYNVLNDVCFEKVMDYAGKSQVLVFVHSRKETIRTAKFLRDRAITDGSILKFFEEGSASKEILNAEKDKCKSLDLQGVLPFGFGVHHAGLQRRDRKLVEDLFADKHIQVLISTATLAWGVNLPAHTVIIKGTQVYVPELGRWSELPPLDVVQMIGRAGRPQYDSSGHGIIITQHSQLQYYISLTNQQLPIESQMISHLPDLLNAEIVLGTIRHRRDAVTWLGNTYLLVRMLRNPALYGIAPEQLDSDKGLVQRRIDLSHAALVLLDQHRLIHYDRRSGSVQTTALGRAASHYYLKYPTVAVLNKLLAPSLTDIDLFRIFSLVNEFALVPVRPEEKQELARVVERVPIPVKGQLSEPATKINVLLQVFISCLRLEGFALQADMVLVQQNAGRILRAIFEICLRRGWASAARLALNYCKVVDRRMWSTMSPLRQFQVLSPVDIKKIERRDFPWERYYDLTPAELGELVKNPQLGRKLHKLVHQFPKLEVVSYVQPLTSTVLQFELTITADFEWNSKAHKSSELFWIFVENVDGEKILHYDQCILTEANMELEHVITFTVPVDSPPPPNCFIRVISDRWIASETTVAVSFRDLVLPAKNPPPSELLDLQPLPLASLNFPEAEEKLYHVLKEFQSRASFNAIQTQVFGALFLGNDNALVCAPPSSGKTVCAEMAILRMLKTETSPLCVYLAPLEEIARAKFEFWQRRFGLGLGLNVNMLGGDLNADLRTLALSQLVITTPDHWDAVSRRWKTRAVVKNVRLLIVDYVQLLNDPVIGSTIEVCVSRTRFVSASLNLSCRIVGIGTSIANAKDVGDWLGVTKNLFNFHPNVRTIPLELSIHRFDMADRQGRILAMYQPMCHIVRRSGVKPVIIISTDRREARLAAIEILLHTAAEGKPERYRRADKELIQQRIEAVEGPLRERILEEALLLGVGIVHEGMPTHERNLVEGLFSEEMIQIVILTAQSSWSFHETAHLVVIQDTEFWDVKKKRWTHYPINSVMQFLGHAARLENDSKTGCQVTLFCRSSKREEFKRFIFEALPLESMIDSRLSDHLLAEIVTGTIKNKQDAIDWITWTFAYRRLSKNPNYYGLKKATPELISDYLSDLVETATDNLQQANCISLNNEVDLVPLNLGLIAAFYYLQYKTVELFNSLVGANSGHLGLLSILTSATEIEERLQIRSGEAGLLRNLSSSVALIPQSSEPDFSDPHVKALVLLTAHFKRVPLSQDLQNDLAVLLIMAHRLAQGLVDVISSNGWLSPTLAAMEISQMIVQATMPNYSSLLQLPHVDASFVEIANRLQIKEVFDLSACEDEVRDKLFEEAKLTETQIAEIAEGCNNFPVVDIEFDVKLNGVVVEAPLDRPKQFSLGSIDSNEDVVSLAVNVKRDLGESKVGSVVCPLFPAEKAEQWWLLVGEVTEGRVVSIKRVSIQNHFEVEIDSSVFTPMEIKTKEDDEMPSTAAEKSFALYLMSDSYLGCDQELVFSLNIATYK